MRSARSDFAKRVSVEPAWGPTPEATAAAPLIETAQGARPWPRRYRYKIRFIDAIVLTAVAAMAQAARFGVGGDVAIGSTLTYTGLGALIVVTWWCALQVYGATDVRTVGVGPQEYRRVLHASIMVVGLLSTMAVLWRFDLSRAYLAIVFSAGLAGLFLSRKILRSQYWRRLRRGDLSSNVLVIGGIRSAMSIDAHLSAHPSAGLKVSGVWIPDESEAGHRWLDGPSETIPVLGVSRDLDDALRVAGADTVIVTDTEHLGTNGLSELTWQLQQLKIDLVVSPNVVNISTPRVKLRTVGAMPFLHLEPPTYEGTQRWGKLVFDKVFAGVALTLISPLMVVTALAVAVTSRGPVLYRSDRIGVGGVPFSMLKFRTMVHDADKLKVSLTSDSEGVLFKMKDDPRVTRVGRFLRRWSIDELPQFINVVRGEMSIVGPRPPLPEEVVKYTNGIERRLLVKQGITGLWQVSGRSDLSWERTVRLDLDYVENWSLTRDIHIIWLTFMTVIRGRGAY